MPRECGASSNHNRAFYIENSMVTGSSAFADDDGGAQFTALKPLRLSLPAADPGCL